MQQIAQTLVNKGLEAPAQYTAQYFAIKLDKTCKALRHKAFWHCTVLLHSIAQYRADLRISLHLLCNALQKKERTLCNFTNGSVEKSAVFDQKQRYFRQRIHRTIVRSQGKKIKPRCLLRRKHRGLIIAVICSVCMPRTPCRHAA